MANPEKNVSWVVYRVGLRGKPSDVNAVCEQKEWDALVLSQPGVHTLIQAGIANEGVAEQLARQKPADPGVDKP
jgi:hypothetical protein